jgi:ribonuclease Z
VSARQLVVLGTASQVPTRYRNHNGYLLFWDDEAILFDPGEGTQRQLTLAGVAASKITRICITHFHGDHCLGLPGVVQRLSLEAAGRPVDVYFPATGRRFYDHLLQAAIFDQRVELRAHEADAGRVAPPPPFELVAKRLDHRADTLGWRLVEPDGRRMLPRRLHAMGVRGPDFGRLPAAGANPAAGGRVTPQELREPRRGQRFAFVMDTRMCEAAVELARDADLLVCEATYLSRHEELAEAYGHLTAVQAARIAADAGARQLVLTHFSQRYDDESELVAEAQAVFPNVIVARDLMRVQVPPRRQTGGQE